MNNNTPLIGQLYRVYRTGVITQIRWKVGLYQEYNGVYEGTKTKDLPLLICFGNALQTTQIVLYLGMEYGDVVGFVGGVPDDRIGNQLFHKVLISDQINYIKTHEDNIFEPVMKTPR